MAPLTIVAPILLLSAPPLFEKESAYNHIVVEQRGEVRYLHFRRAGQMFDESAMDLGDKDLLLLRYTRGLMSMFLYPRPPKRVLMIGLGAGSVSRAIVAQCSECQVDSVELDPEVVEAARRYFFLDEIPRHHVHVGDGRVFVRRHRGPKWDAIVLDAFRGGFVPFHLKTREFYALLKDRLEPCGLVLSNVHQKTRDQDLVTFAGVFAHVDELPKSGVLVAYDTCPQGEPTRESVRRRAAALLEDPRAPRFYAELAEEYTPDPARRAVEGFSDDFAPVDFLMGVDP